MNQNVPITQHVVSVQQVLALITLSLRRMASYGNNACCHPLVHPQVPLPAPWLPQRGCSESAAGAEPSPLPPFTSLPTCPAHLQH